MMLVFHPKKPSRPREITPLLLSHCHRNITKIKIAVSCFFFIKLPFRGLKINYLLIESTGRSGISLFLVDRVFTFYFL